MAKIKCICLVRVSTTQQDFEGQKEKVVANAMADGYKPNEIAVVQGKESAIKLAEQERETLTEMKAIITANPSIESVYVFAIDRLARKVSVILSVKDYLTQRGINLVFLNPHKMSTLRRDEKTNGLVEDELTNMLLMFLSYGAEMEMKIKKERFKAGRMALIKQNKWFGGKPIFGYVNDNNGNLQEDGEKADFVRKMFKEYLNGKTCIELFYEMVACGYAKDKKQSAAKLSINRILRNKAYKGDKSDRGQNIVYPPIVDAELWQQVQDKMNGIKTEKRKTNNFYFGKSLVRNKTTKMALAADIATLTYHDPSDTNRCSININAMDTIIWRETITQIKILQQVEKLNKPNEYKNEIAELEKKVANIDEQIESVRGKEKKLLKLYVNGLILDEDNYENEITQIKKRIAQFEKEKATLKSQITQFQMLLDEHRKDVIYNPFKYDDLTDEQKQKLCQKYLDSVEIEKVGNKYVIQAIPKIVFRHGEFGHAQQQIVHKATYTYYCRGGVMHLLVCKGVPQIEYDITDTIMYRFSRKPHHTKKVGEIDTLTRLGLK